MKKYSLRFAFLILLASLIILGGCGTGQIVDLSRNSGEYIDVEDAKTALTDGVVGLIKHCGGKSQAIESCDEFHRVYYSSEKESSSSKEEPSSSSISSSSSPPSSSSVAAPSSSSSRLSSSSSRLSSSSSSRLSSSSSRLSSSSSRR